MSSYFDIFSSIYGTAVNLWPKKRITWAFLSDFVADLTRFCRVQPEDLAIVCAFAVALTLLRTLLTTHVLKPFSLRMKFTSRNVTKFCESWWKFSYYLLMYIYSCYLLFGKGYPYFTTPRTCWIEWFVGMHIPTDIYFLYAIQMGFYMHSIYATFYMDPWRKDSVAMVIHHFLTIFLIGFSFAVRYYKIGVVVLFLHDICDVLLEACKLLTCLKIMNNKNYNWPDYFINSGFLAFSLSWFYCRLYLYPYKVLYPGGHYAIYMHPNAPFYYFFNGMLQFLFAMNVYWFHYIILLIWRVATGQSREVEDTRELGMDFEETVDMKRTTVAVQERTPNAACDISSDTAMKNKRNIISRNGNCYKNHDDDASIQKTNNGVFLNHAIKDEQIVHAKIE